MKGFTYHTQERMKWHLWPRRKRIDFMRRYRKRHGRKFRWMKAEYIHFVTPLPKGEITAIFHKHDPKPVNNSPTTF